MTDSWTNKVSAKLYEGQPWPYKDKHDQKAIIDQFNDEEKWKRFVVMYLRTCDPTEGEGVIHSLMNIFVSTKRSRELVLTIANNEFEQYKTDSASLKTLFRGGSYANKSISIFCRVYGSFWIKSVSQDFVTNVEEKVKQDPDSWNQRELSDENANYIIETVNGLIDKIINNLKNLPPIILSVFSDLLKICTAANAEKAVSLITSLFFLRFFNISISNPQTFNLCKQPKSSFRKALTWIGKVFQNIANNTIPSVKQPLLKRFDEVTEQCTAKFTKAFKKVLKSAEKKNSNDFNPDEVLNPTDEIVVCSYEHLLQYCLIHFRDCKENLGEEAPVYLACLNPDGYEAAEKEFTENEKKRTMNSNTSKKSKSKSKSKSNSKVSSKASSSRVAKARQRDRLLGIIIIILIILAVFLLIGAIICFAI